jgi:hypothetical protein
MICPCGCNIPVVYMGNELWKLDDRIATMNPLKDILYLSAAIRKEWDERSERGI